jgi:RecJ-like exonuclease
MAPGLAGPLARVTGRLARLIRTAGDRLFRDADTRASQYGWQITARRGGLARTYRDPRFDRFRRCPACQGTGTHYADQACRQCAGTGRITVAQPFLSDRGPGR